MAWRPVKSIVHAVCVQRFEATQSNDVALEIGDDVYVTEIGGAAQDWCRGWLLEQPTILTALHCENGQALMPRVHAGIFPRNCIEIREVLTQGTSEEIGYTDIAHTNGDYTLEVPTNAPRRGRSNRRTRILPRRPSDAHLIPINVTPKAPGDSKEEAPLPALRIGDATPFSTEEPLVDDISSCLREWHSTHVHQLVLGHDYDLLEKLSDLAGRLDNARKQLIHDLLTEKELALLRERTVWDLVDGNKLLGGEVIVRSPQEKGRILTAQDSIPEMLELQALMSMRHRPPPPPVQESLLSHLMVDLKETGDMNGEPGVLHLYLCRQASDLVPRAVSEVFAVEVPFDRHSLDNLTSSQQPKTLFTDLTKAEIGSATDPSSHLYLVCLLHREEAPRKRIIAPAPTVPQSDAVDSQTRSESTGPRRSLFWASQRGRRNLERTNSQEHNRPLTRESSRSKIRGRPRTPTAADGQGRPMTAEKKLRRVVGYGVVEIGELVRQHGHTIHNISLWTPAEAFEKIIQEPTAGVDGWEDVIKSLVRSPTGSFTKASSVGRFQLDLHAFAHANADTLVKDNPILLRDVYCTQALNLSSGSAQQRSDVYLTLKEPLIPPGAHCFHPQEGSVAIPYESDLRSLQLTCLPDFGN
jgi:dedicator of cytokinesis protein 3